MNTSAQIRLLLAVVCATFLLTAFVVKQTFTPKVNLEQTGAILQNNLNEKEAYVNKLINDKYKFDQLKLLADKPTEALNYIQDYTTDNRIWLYTYNKNKLQFWSGVKLLPNAADYTEGVSFRKEVNGYYQFIKKTDGNFTAIFAIPIKNIYPFKNKYLHNSFDKDILPDDNTDIADFTDKQVYNIHAVNHNYLFSIKLKPGAINHRYYYFEIMLWLLGFITLCMLIHKICNYLVNKGYTFISFILLTVFIGLFRFISLKFNWPNLSDFEIFKPGLFSAGLLSPSFGQFFFNILGAGWLASFIYYHRYRIVKKTSGKTTSFIITIAGSMLLIGLSALLLQLCSVLVINSHINFDVTNVFNLSGYSWLGILILCFSFLLFYLTNDIFLTILRRLIIRDKYKVYIFSSFILAATLVTIIMGDFSLFYVLTGLFVAVRAYTIWNNDGKLTAPSFLALITICALISAIKLNYFQQIKEDKVRKILIHKLESSVDNVAESYFRHIEKEIIKDTKTIDYLANDNRNEAYLSNYLQKNYFDGYLSKYDLTLYAFNAAGTSITSDKQYSLDIFKNLVALTAMSVSTYFYHDEILGHQAYFAILPVYQDKTDLGTIVIKLLAKPPGANISFPELLTNSDNNTDDGFKEYSHAYYIDTSLQSQSGNYPYKLTNTEFKGELKKYVVTDIKKPKTKWYKPEESYNHLIYKPDNRSMIVVSRQETPVLHIAASITFFFLIFLSFSALVIFTSWLWGRVRLYRIENKQLKWGFKINLDKIAYRSRIQFSVMFTVVTTLLLIGAITFHSISLQYDAQQDEMIRNKLSGIAALFGKGLKKGDYDNSKTGEVNFNEFAKTYLVDLTLFDKEGKPLFSTQPKIYDYNLLAKKMNGRAFIAMAKQHQSMFLNDEKLGELNYKAAYVPVTDAQYKTLAYLQLPYFDNQNENTERTGEVLNSMINIYAIVFIVIGLFAVLIARQITWPLQFIQHSISKTIYGRKNEPIVWDRDDEIGSLVKEYNKMISELEVSAQRLAQSERETAWREMAKQVAHEIKNPLTPLKLGLQLLDKAWRDKDPKFDQKFERFSKSFVEQIDSLSSIASEFSAFAKMPDTKMERVDLFDIINQAVIIFKQMDNVTITYNPGDPFYVNADRDQLMRCFNNLLKNAIEAIPIGKHGIIRVTCKTEINKVLIMLTDNGNGIPDNLRQKIFVPNFTTKSSGTGLGLAFVKNSIENSGGKVWFETETGKGTTFFISCPAAV